jgi:hypothetical protein
MVIAASHIGLALPNALNENPSEVQFFVAPAWALIF